MQQKTGIDLLRLAVCLAALLLPCGCAKMLMDATYPCAENAQTDMTAAETRDEWKEQEQEWQQLHPEK